MRVSFSYSVLKTLCLTVLPVHCGKCCAPSKAAGGQSRPGKLPFTGPTVSWCVTGPRPLEAAPDALDLHMEPVTSLRHWARRRGRLVKGSCLHLYSSRVFLHDFYPSKGRMGRMIISKWFIDFNEILE